MIKSFIYFLITALILIAGCTKKDKTGDKMDSCYSNENARTLLHDQVEREYVLYVPDSYDGKSSVPLLLNFHGFGGSASKYMAWADMRSLAETETFILVYPQGSCLDGSSHWNPCPLGGDNKSRADDIGFVDAMVGEISSQFKVDMARIYAVGYSNGGMMAYGLANFKSELIAAVASVSGTMLDCIGPTNHPMPVIYLHGTSDDVLPYNGNEFYSSAQNIADHWINFNKTNLIPKTGSSSSGGMTIEQYIYDQGDSGVSVEHYKYVGGDHVWFKQTFENQTTSDLIWNFVSKYDINGLR